MLDILEGKEHYCVFDGINAVGNNDGKYCYVPTTHKITLAKIVELLEKFKKQPDTLVMPEIPERTVQYLFIIFTKGKNNIPIKDEY